jgi:hypothetical protein
MHVLYPWSNFASSLETLWPAYAESLIEELTSDFRLNKFKKI